MSLVRTDPLFPSDDFGVRSLDATPFSKGDDGFLATYTEFDYCTSAMEVGHFELTCLALARAMAPLSLRESSSVRLSADAMQERGA